jgi:hypothetical protein
LVEKDARRTYSTNDLYQKIDQKWSGHGLTSLTGSYGLDLIMVEWQ